MTVPFVMLGSGGSYVSRYYANGGRLVKETESAQGHDPQGESSGGHTGGSRPRRSTRSTLQQVDGQSALTKGATTPHWLGPRDAFEHIVPPAQAATYRPASGLTACDRPATMACAVYLATWLTTQGRILRQLAADCRALLPQGLTISNSSRSPARSSNACFKEPDHESDA